MNLPPAIDYFQRFCQILGIIVRQLWKLAMRLLRRQPLNGPLVVREGFELAGGCFLKVGQILSLQIDTLPREYCDALLGLLDDVPAAGKDQVLAVFKQEFHAAPEEIFGNFDYHPIASASIGQVHRAELRDGAVVAVKVQRPGVPRDFHRDLVLMQAFVRIVFLLGIRHMYFLRDPVRETRAWTRDELDYRREAAHCDQLADAAKDSRTERIPKIYWDLTTPRVLTMEFLEGHTVSRYLQIVERGDEAELARLRESGFVPEIFSSNVISNFLRDAFRKGVFHADLHPANLLILPNNVVGYVDFGIVATLTPEARRKQIELTLAYATGSSDAIYREFLNICTPAPDADLEGMRREIAQLSKYWYFEPAVGGHVRFRVSVTAAMMDLLTVSRYYGVLVDREMIKYIRSTFLVDGVVSRLSPGFDIAGALRRLVEEYVMNEAQRRVLTRAATVSMLTDLVIWMKTGPAAMLRALDLYERREYRERGIVHQRQDPYRGLRLRAFTAAAIWAIAIAFLATGGGMFAWKASRWLSVLAGAFIVSWTIWVLLLMRRLGRI